VTVVTEANIEQLHPKDRAEVEAFQDFLSLGVGPEDGRRIPREFPGWLPYCLGEFFYAAGGALLVPPAGFDDVPVTAWTFPA
jgi:hypothetical protein